ncbi:HTH-type transcriptional regulator MalT [Deinococcus xinjiangensis]|uniref:HTH-type transcriptional regulator MalT n=1 Tax=Deinococcus xinjiangensis TaxID=457454 RepID=A0ABP9V8K2_9DEIO
MALSFLSRKRLLGVLWRDDAPNVSLLLAPAGYGKSVLLGQVLEEKPLAVFLNLREIEGDAYSLVNHLADALEATSTAAAAAIRQGNSSKTMPAFHFAQHLAELPASLLIIDHAERLQIDGEKWLLDLISLLPKKHRLILAGRSLTSFGLPMLVATDQVQVIGPEQLAFDQEEEALLAKQARAPKLDLSTLKGWPMAVKLTLTGAYGQNVHTLLRALLRSLTPELQSALVRLAPYDQWSDFLPEQLGLRVPGDWMAQLLLSSLPILQNDNGTVTPHELLLEVLDAELAKNPEMRVSAYREAAAQAMRQNRSLHAIQLLQRVALQTEATALAEQVLGVLSHRGQFRLVLDMLDKLPQDAIHESTMLTLYYGLALIENEQLQAGMAQLQLVADLPSDRWRALPYLTHGTFLLSRIHDAEKLIVESKDYWEHYTPEQQMTLRVTEGNVQRELGHPERSLEILIEAVELAQKQNLPFNQAAARIGLNVTYLRLQRFEEAMASARHALRIFEEIGMYNRLPVAMINLAVLHSVRDELTHARELLLRALEISEAQSTRHVTAILFVLGNVCRKEGKNSEAIFYLSQSIERAQLRSAWDYMFMAELMLSEIYRQQHQHVEADRQIKAAEDLAKVYPTLRESQLLAQLIEFHNGQRALAQHDLERALEHFGRVPTHVGELDEWAARAALYIALIKLKQNQLEKADIAAFMTLHEKLTSRVYLHLDLETTRPVLREAVQREWYVPELQDYAFGTSALKQHRIYVRTLGGLQITLNGEPLPMIGNNPRRAQELLVLLALLPAPSASDINNALVGDGKGDGRQAIKSLRQSLTKATGVTDPLVLTEQRKYELNNEITLRTDYHDLQRAIRSKNISQVRKLLVKTEFLPGLDRAWVDDWRESEIPALLYAAYEVLGTEALSRQAYQDALHNFKEMQRLMPMNEKPLRTIIEIYRATGDTKNLQEFEREFSVVFAHHR